MNILYIIICIILFGLLIAVHEFGHFIVAKACNVKVNEFSIGMGPLIFQKQKGETQYSLRLLPVGGFCAMEGEDGDSDDDRAFSKAAAWKRFLILVAGAAFNFLTGLIIILLLYASAQTYTAPVLSGFMDGFPLEGEEYLMAGDEIVAINGRRVLLTGDISTLMMLANSDTVDLTIRRDGETRILKNLPLTLRDYEENGQTVRRYGLYLTTKEAMPLDRLRIGLYTAADFVRQVFWSMMFLKGLLMGYGLQAEDFASYRNSDYVYFTPGSTIFFLILNTLALALFRRQIPERLEGAVHFVGLVLLLVLMGAVAINDVYKIVT